LLTFSGSDEELSMKQEAQGLLASFTSVLASLPW
jgi:hypothetical protein